MSTYDIGCTNLIYVAHYSTISVVAPYLELRKSTFDFANTFKTGDPKLNMPIFSP